MGEGIGEPSEMEKHIETAGNIEGRQEAQEDADSPEIRKEETISELVDSAIDQSVDIANMLKRIADRRNYDKSDFVYRVEEAKKLVATLEEAFRRSPEAL